MNHPLVPLLGRILLAAIFILSGFGKITAYAGTQGYMEHMGLPGSMLPLVILLELGGGILLVLGYFTRWTALALALFSIATALIFHSGGDQTQQIMFLKNLAMAGGFLMLMAHGAGPWSLDAKRQKD
ncbi:DoxX family protein [Gallaecimonas kandeliae]|uniref:DoxX family protein n=1 Tax=Gallaecimonas kandeliae TaxID=3029055 RepID=UPI002648FEC7|nr:DoxX family protein [Gallaecimonas kandeliae]WKE65245.1 DoxX family protein [Gallaecimonas kandeliae]